MMGDETTGISRREEYAEATRQAIVAAARQLFREHGFFSTKVSDIAALARVAPATVYAVCGGKQGLLHTIVDESSTAQIVADLLSRIEQVDDPAAIIALVAAVVRAMRESSADIMHVLLATAPHDEAAAKSLAIATARYRGAFEPIARRLAELDALQAGIDVEAAVDVMWFYFGYAGLFTLHDDNGWTYERAERWLRREASRALLRNGAEASSKEEHRPQPPIADGS
jgi:AcrR family transcriptional regulator